MKVIVMKFGGTSVKDDYSRSLMLEHIVREVGEGFKVLVVVSAMGRLGSVYATDTLKSLVTNHISNRESDRLLSCGEVISSIVISDMMKAAGVNVTSLAPVELGILTDCDHTDANILEVDSSAVFEKFQEYDVLIAPGFVGVSERGFVTTLGRGGSDTSAIALGNAVGAEFVDIYSDVPGVMTADPKIDPNATLISEMSYDELTRIAEAGAKVIHLKAILMAKEYEINLRLRSTFEQSVGTYVLGHDE